MRSRLVRLFRPGPSFITCAMEDEDDKQRPLMLDTNANVEQRRKFLHKLRLAYFSGGFCGTACDRWILYFYLNKNLAPAHIGSIEALKPIAQFAGSQTLAILGDKLRGRKWISINAQVISASLLMLLLIPPLGCDQCNWSIGLIVCLAAFACMPATAVLDVYAIDALVGSCRDDYGKLRLGFALSWGVSGFITGKLADFDVRLPFAFYGACTIFQTMLLIFILPPGGKSKASSAQVGVENPKFGDFMRVIALPRRLFFLFEMILFGAGLAVIEKCLFVFAMTELGASAELCGLTVLSTTIPELPVFYLGHKLLRRLGRDTCFLIVIIAYTIRVGSFCLLRPENVEMLLLIEILHGVIYGLGWLIAVDFWREDIPQEWTLSSMIVLNVAKDCVGASAGAFLGGWFLEQGSFAGMKRGRALYSLAATSAIILFILHSALCVYLRMQGVGSVLASKN